MLLDDLEGSRWRWCRIHVSDVCPWDEMRPLTDWNSGVLVLFGGVLLVLSSILEFIIGNTFPSVVFGHLGMLDIENRVRAGVD